jgi:glycosyltransferase involved in cell wall biosynthesis
LNLEIIVADDGSVGADFSTIASMDPRISVFRFRDGRGHPQALQWLWYRARGEYVVVMDQDSILVGNPWKPFEMEFEDRPELLLIGVRDQCRLRGSPEMLHPSFIMAHKERCEARLARPLFFGPKPGAAKYRFAPVEEYYAFFCKALDWNPRSIRYLDQHQTKYGFGTIAYRDQPDQPVIYHQWYSGRVHGLGDDALIDNLFKVSVLRESSRQFLREYREGVADLTERELPV